MKHPRGGVVDERVPDLSDVLTRNLGVNRQAFTAWLAPRLGRYRLGELMRAQATTRKAELAALRALEARLGATADAIAFGALPPAAEALMNDSLYRMRGEQLHELTERTLQGVHTLRALAAQAAQAIRTTPGRAGRRPSTPRDDLLRDVLAELARAGLKGEDARSVAEQVLVRCGVPVPADDRSIRRAAQRAT